MAITIMLALVAAFALAITLVPALVAILIRGKVAEKDVWLIRKSKECYLPLLDQAIARPWPFILGGLAFFVAAIPAFGLLGSEFIPQLDEKNLAFASTRVPRSAERRVGKECVSTCRSRWSPSPLKNKN